MTKLKFEQLSLSEETLKAIQDMGFEEASPIQSETIPLLLEGKDVIGQAQTGTGKTAAFAIPIIEKIESENDNIQALIMSPTRELAIQIAEEFRKLLKYKKNIEVAAIYGGQEIGRQFRTLQRKPQIIVGTPGRLMDHLKRKTIKLNNIRFVVLDEADEMLDMGFREDIEDILKDTPESRQTIMFAATMQDSILKLTKKFQNNPQKIDVTHLKINAPQIEQIYYEITEKAKPEALFRLLDMYDVKLGLVFCNTKMQVGKLVEMLKTRGYLSEGLHGDMNQNQRDKVMNGFRKGTIEVLVATDVAGRGIDVNNIEAVFNYDLPRDMEDYVHRIGRTARAGRKGIAFTFVVGKQIYNLKKIEKENNIKVLQGRIPKVQELDESKLENIGNKIKEIVESEHIAKYINMVEKLMEDNYTALDIAAALLKLDMDKKNENYSEHISFEKEEFREERSGFRRGRGDSRSNYSSRDDGRANYSRNSEVRGNFGKSREDRGNFFKSKDGKFDQRKTDDSKGNFVKNKDDKKVKYKKVIDKNKGKRKS